MLAKLDICLDIWMIWLMCKFCIGEFQRRIRFFIIHCFMWHLWRQNAWEYKIYGNNREDVGVQLLNITLRQHLYIVSWAHIIDFNVIKYMKYKNRHLFLQFWNLILKCSDRVVLLCVLFNYFHNAHPIPPSILLCNIK